MPSAHEVDDFNQSWRIAWRIARLIMTDLGVSKNSGTPKWMVFMENPIKMDDLGIPLFSETSISFLGGKPFFKGTLKHCFAFLQILTST